MVKIVLITHGELAQCLIKTAQHMLAFDTEDIKSFSVSGHSDIEKISSALKEYFIANKDKGVLVLTDIFGGSGCNLSILASKNIENISVLSGVNLAMFISALQNMDKLSLTDLAAKAENDARRSILNATNFLSSVE